MFLRSRRFGRRPPAAGLAIPAVPSFCLRVLLPGLLAAGDRLLRALAGTGVCTGALTPDGQSTPVPQALVASDLDLALDVGRDLAAQVTFDLEVLVDVGPKLCDFFVSEIADTRIGRD